MFGQQKLLIGNSLPVQGIWPYEGMLDKKLLKVEAFSFPVSQQDSLMKDIIPIFEQYIDTVNHILHTSIFVSPRFHFEFDGLYSQKGHIKEYYNDAGLLQKTISTPIDTNIKHDKKTIRFNIKRTIHTPLYDSNNMVISFIIEEFDDEYKIQRSKNDTCIGRWIKTIKYSYTYNDKQQEQKCYYFEDRVRLTSCDPASQKPYSYPNRKEYLYSEYLYSEDTNTTHITYLPDGKSYTYTTFITNNQISKIIDTIYPPPCPDCAMTIKTDEYFYEGNLLNKLVTSEKTGNRESINITQYDRFGHPLESCSYLLPFDSCEEHVSYEYLYDGDKVTYMKSIHDQNIEKQYYTYNNEGLVIEDKHIMNGDVYSWIIYRYVYF